MRVLLEKTRDPLASGLIQLSTYLAQHGDNPMPRHRHSPRASRLLSAPGISSNRRRAADYERAPAAEK
jgi:hypothetical protein